MGIGLAAAIVAALGYGLASVLQARAAGDQRPDDGGTPSLRSTLTTMTSALFIVGLCLDTVGFAANLVADRNLALFLAQPIIASNLVVTAIAASLLLGVHLSGRDRAAIGAVVLALIALGFAAGTQGGPTSGWAGSHHALVHWGLLVIALAVLGGGLLLLRVASGATVAGVAGLLAGSLFGVMAVAVRVADGVEPFHLTSLLADPAAYTVAVAGAGGFYLFTVALQTGSVNAAAAALVVGETVIPGVVGLALLGDTVRHGWWPVAGVAFVVAVAGAVLISQSDATQLE
ncbi:hypothetical protein HUN08_00510 [Gordonia sp. X0973]|uniref:hypothetical protein n=1 Tax=Gordonia sp. X0973 TaxID=2742602 RepID=UPI000F529FBC|nr:hypothetical protein [Gordonia sp. X0973]QKT05846.1 hypothetical protein HUN08_00510 [Gordonia sp. X0973]